jgi:oligosaccharide repeat unit polymerase
MDMGGGKTILQKVDFFIILFLFFITGVLAYDVFPLVIPLRHPILQKELLTIMLIAFASYLLGKKLAGYRLKIKNKAFPVCKKSSIFILKVLIIFLFSLALAFYLRNGIPLFETGSSAASLKGQLVVKKTYGMTRIMYVILPYLATLLYTLKQKVFGDNKSLHATFIYLLLPFILLFFGLFKGAILTYVCGIIVMFDKYRQRIHFSFKTIVYTTLICLAIIIPIYLTEINDFSSAALYVVNRLMTHSWEGFNYIILNDLGPTFIGQFKTFLGLQSDPTPGIMLASEFTGINPPPMSINTTLFGFAYRNGGIILVIVIFFFLGYFIKKIIEKFSNTRDNVAAVTYLFIYIALLKMFLVGEPFIDLRGVFLSLLFVHFLSKFILNPKIR